MRLKGCIIACSFFVFLGFFAASAADYYGGSAYGELTGTILSVKVNSSYASIYSYVKIANKDNSSATAYNGITLTPNTKSTGWVSFTNTDKQILATLLWAQAEGITLDVYLETSK